VSTEENEAIVREIVEAFNRGDHEAVDRLFAATYVDHDPSRAGLPLGPEGVKQAWGILRAAFPDLRGVIDGMVTEGDKVALRGTFQGTHAGELMGVSPTGQRVTITLIDINRIENGKLAERWGQADMLGMMRQLGVAPPSKQAGA
jgi:predicted ester cyclase